jgi:hypothetical protein
MHFYHHIASQMGAAVSQFAARQLGHFLSRALLEVDASAPSAMQLL